MRMATGMKEHSIVWRMTLWSCREHVLRHRILLRNDMVDVDLGKHDCTHESTREEKQIYSSCDVGDYPSHPHSLQADEIPFIKSVLYVDPTKLHGQRAPYV